MIRSDSADSTGATVRTGEQIRTRRLARLIRFAIRRDNASPNPGVNQARTLLPAIRTGFGSTKPLPSTIPFDQSCSKSAVKSAASFVDSTIRITFSCRVHESSVQFADPVQTVLPSRTTYLWCMISGMPAIGRCATPSDEISSTSGSGGGGTGIGFRWPTS